MAEVLVLVDHVDGAVRKPTPELLTLARRIGEPSAVFLGPAPTTAPARWPSTARQGLRADDAGVRRLPRRAEGRGARRSSSSRSRRPRCSSRPPPRARRSRPAWRSGRLGHHHRRRRRGGRRRRLVTTQSVFAGSLHRARATVTKGTPVITVKPELAPRRRRPPAAGAVEALAVDAVRRRQGRQGHRRASRGEATGRPELTEAAIVVSGGRGTAGDFAPGRGARRLARRRRRRLARRGRRRLVPAHQPGRPDRQDGLAAAVHRLRHLRRDPAPGRHADLEDDRRDQQGRRGADLRAGRLRRGRRPVQGRAAADRGDPKRKG